MKNAELIQRNLSILLISVALAACTTAVSEPVAAPVETEPLPVLSTHIPDTNDLPDVSMAFIGLDGNLWGLSGFDSSPRQLTQDATSIDYNAAQPTSQVSYYFPSISSDGRFVAIRRDAGTPVEGGFDFTLGLWIYDIQTDEFIQVYDQNPAGFDWKPGTHILAFGQAFSEAYFSSRGQVDSSFAKSILAYDADAGTTTELVKPERGFAIYGATWSPDGRYLSFEEVNNYEGSGMFAYYDFEGQVYVSWEEAIGLYGWSPDNTQIAYDRMTYSATGTERIFLRPLSGGEERQLSKDSGEGYAFSPVFSPAGDRIAFFTHSDDPDSQMFVLHIQDVIGGEPLMFGPFESVQSPGWLTDGSQVVFVAGPFGDQQIIAVNIQDGTVTSLAQGTDLDIS